MQVNIQMVTTNGDQKTVHDILGLERKELSIETLGLTLNESKAMTAAIQKTMVDAQVEEYLSEHKSCPQCGKLRPIKGYHSMICRTLFGRVSLKSPRLLECSCQGQKATTVSPLPKALVGQSSTGTALLRI